MHCLVLIKCNLKGGENNMKKILALVLALSVIFGAGAEVVKVTDNSGEPPIGSFTSTEVASDFTTMGEPPIGS